MVRAGQKIGSQGRAVDRAGANVPVVPNEFDDQRVDVGQVDDRRGGGGRLPGGGLAIGGGAGVVGVIIYVVVTLLGGNPAQLQLPTTAGSGAQAGGGSAAGAETSDQLRTRCNSDGAIDKYTDCRLIKAFNVADTTWKAEFDRRGQAYRSPKFGLFTGATQTGCGQASAEVGPFYCPPDEEIYFDVGFLGQLQKQLGFGGGFAFDYVVAHEFGHHLQTLLGTEPKVRQAQQRNPSQGNKYSVALELQADCYAGGWANLADASTSNGVHLSSADISGALDAAAKVGDDYIQKKMQGQVNPESFTHGTSAQRDQWFTTGYKSGDITACNTFSG